MAAAKRSTQNRAPDALDRYREKRDFSKTREPAGSPPRQPDRGSLVFVVQKHAATSLHFDFRLELDGVMKSWAVPKGPSLDPKIKRLAMQVEDHPIEYNQFEGTIPKGEYGGGTVMIWDRGTYAADRDAAARTADNRTDVQILRDGYERGNFKFVLFGERLQGSWVLVKTHFADERKTQRQWLLIKHRDAYAVPGSDITDTDETSVVSGRTMEEIAAAHLGRYDGTMDVPASEPPGRKGDGESTRASAQPAKPTRPKSRPRKSARPPARKTSRRASTRGAARGGRK